MANYRSITQVGTSEPFELQVARGQIPGHFPQYKFGFNPDVNDDLETVWSQGGTYFYPPAQTQMTVSSSSDSDTANEGDGARTVQIYGLDGNYNEINETVLLDGQTHVTTTKSFLRTNRAIVRTAGDEEKNIGVIYVGTGTVTAGVPVSKYATIAAGENQTLMALWTVPAGHTAFLQNSLFTVATIQSNKVATVTLVARPLGETFQVKDKVVISEGSDARFYNIPIKFTEKTDIEVRCIANSSNANVNISAGLDLLYIKNEDWTNGS